MPSGFDRTRAWRCSLAASGQSISVRRPSCPTTAFQTWHRAQSHCKEIEQTVTKTNNEYDKAFAIYRAINGLSILSLVPRLPYQRYGPNIPCSGRRFSLETVCKNVDGVGIADAGHFGPRTKLRSRFQYFTEQHQPFRCFWLSSDCFTGYTPLGVDAEYLKCAPQYTGR